jgi:hypothetical protein
MSDPQDSSSTSPDYAPIGITNSLADILQMYAPNMQTGQITYYTNDQAGYIYLHHGQVIHAVLNEVEGEDAVYTMLQWEFGSHTFDEGILAHKRSILRPLEELLFDCARRADRHQQDPDGSALIDSRPRMVEGTKTTALLSSRTQGGVPRLTVIGGDQPPQSYDLEDEFTYAGRAETNTIVLPYGSVSGKHCMLIRNGSDILIRDLNSSNGTMVNGEVITEALLKIGDIVQLGDVTFRFESAIKRPKLTGKPPTPSAALLNKHTTPISRPGSVAVSLDKPLTFAPASAPKKSKVPVVIIILLLLAAGGGAAYYWFYLMPH